VAVVETSGVRGRRSEGRCLLEEKDLEEGVGVGRKKRSKGK